MSAAVLDVRGLTIRFGGLTAVNDVSFEVKEGEIFSVIGPNGAGKTTVFNAISGIYPPTEGDVRVGGVSTLGTFDRYDALSAVAAAVLTAFLLLIAINCEGLWQTSIIDRYVYRQPFPWSEAARVALSYLSDRGFWGTWAPILVGAVLGAGGSLAVWRRSRITPQRVASTGVARTFQNIRLFHRMTALENILIGRSRMLRCTVLDCLFRTPRLLAEERASREQARELLRFVGLEGLEDRIAGNLPYGSQRRLEIARALASEPKVLLLDEPAAGMNPTESHDLMELIAAIRGRGMTVLLIEHHMSVVMGISDRIVVLDYGNKIAEGTPDEVRRDPRVIEAYLGKEDV